MKTKETVIKEIMKDVECSYEDALEIYALEQKDKENNERHYNKSSNTEDKPKKARPKKVDEEKVAIMNVLLKALEGYNPTMTNKEKTIDFMLNGSSFTVSLTKHRNKEQ